MTNTRSLFITLLLLAVIVAVSGQRAGAYEPIEDLKDPTVQEFAKFAIRKHNKKAGTALVYVKTLKAEIQTVAGYNYRLEISAKDGDTVRNYEAVVYDGLREGYHKLQSFKPLIDQSD